MSRGRRVKTILEPVIEPNNALVLDRDWVSPTLAESAEVRARSTVLWDWCDNLPHPRRAAGCAASADAAGGRQAPNCDNMPQGPGRHDTLHCGHDNRMHRATDRLRDSIGRSAAGSVVRRRSSAPLRLAGHRSVGDRTHAPHQQGRRHVHIVRRAVQRRRRAALPPALSEYRAQAWSRGIVPREGRPGGRGGRRHDRPVSAPERDRSARESRCTHAPTGHLVPGRVPRQPRDHRHGAGPDPLRPPSRRHRVSVPSNWFPKKRARCLPGPHRRAASRGDHGSRRQDGRDRRGSIPDGPLRGKVSSRVYHRSRDWRSPK